MLAAPRRHLLLASALLVYFTIVFFTIKMLTGLTTLSDPARLFIDISLVLHTLCIVVFLGWAAFGWVGLNLSLTAALGLVVFVCFTAGSAVFLWNAVFLISSAFVLFHLNQNYDQDRALLDTDFEKIQDQLNDLQVSYKTRGEGISVFFEKYSTYYNLRKLAEDLARMLSIEEVSRTIVEQTLQFIGRGNYCAITLAQNEGDRLPIIAKRAVGGQDAPAAQEGNSYDMWVIKNRKRLIVTDLHADFRFASQVESNAEGLRSVIVAPLLSEGRVMGTLGLYSRHPNLFSHDDLRLLDAIAMLASSAISNSVLYERTNDLAIRDSLTGLYVRRHFYSRLKEEHRRTLMTHKPLALMMCDLDMFKPLNDTYGHQAGDIILTQFTQILVKQLEGTVVARYGGEEFAVILPETTKLQAVQLAENLRKKVEENVFNLRRNEVRLTLSIGVASMPDDAMEVEALIHKADAALYDAKRTGRNRVCFAQP